MPSVANKLSLLWAAKVGYNVLMARTTKVNAMEWVLIILALLLLLSDVALAFALNQSRNDLKKTQMSVLRLEACLNDNTKPCNATQ